FFLLGQTATIGSTTNMRNPVVREVTVDWVLPNRWWMRFLWKTDCRSMTPIRDMLKKDSQANLRSVIPLGVKCRAAGRLPWQAPTICIHTGSRGFTFRYCTTAHGIGGSGEQQSFTAV